MKMRILIVEDEYYFRQALKKYIEKYPDEFEVCDEAKNGCEGLDKLLELQPDIALVDITMPLMNGIALIEKTVQAKIRTKMIILTGYGEFEYAKQAISLGVQDYLLKPLQADELYKSLKKVSLFIEKEHETQDCLRILSTGKGQILSLVKEGFVKKLLMGESVDKKILKANLGFPEKDAQYLAGVIDFSVANNKHWKEEDRGLCNFSICNILYELIIPDGFVCGHCTNEEGMLGIILCSANPGLFGGLAQTVQKLCEKVKEFLGLDVSAYFGTVRSSLADIPEAYAEALAIQRYQLFNKNAGVYFYSDSFKRLNVSLNFFTNEDKKKLMSLMRINSLQEVKDLIAAVFNKMLSNDLVSDTIYMQVMDILSAILNFAAEFNLEVPTPDKNINLFQKLFSLQSLSQLQSFVTDTAAHVMLQTNKHQNGVQEKLARNVSDYIDKNYCNTGLKLETVSREFYVNIQYLCSIFKKYKKMTIGNYILEVRMEHAKQEFMNGTQNITGVAHHCGYEDAGYFSKCFKRHFGVSPKHYLNKKPTK